ncbi:hypothetical protein EV426DRAFT_700398, partial [Tirmania nivea]
MAVAIVEAWKCRHRKHGNLDIGGMAVSTAEAGVDSRGMVMLTSQVWKYRHRTDGNTHLEATGVSTTSVDSGGMGVSTAE